jgi:hypothetical protein
VLRGACDALFTPRPLEPIQDLALEVGPALTDLLFSEATPYQVAATLFEEGETLAKLSSILWCPGRGEEARLTAR